MKSGLLSTTAIVLALATGPALAQSSGSDMQKQDQGNTVNQNQPTQEQGATGQNQGTTDQSQGTTGQNQDTMGQNEDTMGQDQGTTTGSTTPSQGEATTGAQAGASGELFIAEQQQNAVLADEIIGTTVRTANGESVGDVQDLLLSENNGVEAILIGVGGFLGMGEKTVAINYQEVQRSRTEDGTLELVLSTDRAALENAPEFTSRDQMQAQQAQ